jgi:CRP/FNR family transcriptional regulator, cyclic AMP receptor protein
MIVAREGRVLDPGLKSFGASFNAVVRPPMTPLRSNQTSARSRLASDPALCHLLATHPLFGKLPKHEQIALLEWSRLRTASKHDVIYGEGEPARDVFLVLRGFAKLSRSTADGRDIFLELIAPLGQAGSIAVLQQKPYEADLTALSMCRLLAIDGRQFRKVFERQPDGLLAILRLDNERLQTVTERLADHDVLTAPSRLAKTLLGLARLTAPGSNGSLALKLSQHDLGVMANTSRETVNKQLRAWRTAGWIAMSDGKVISVRADKLSELAADACYERERRRASA